MGTPGDLYSFLKRQMIKHYNMIFEPPKNVEFTLI